MEAIWSILLHARRLTQERKLVRLNDVLTHRVRPVSAPLAKHVEHLWMAQGFLSGRWRNMILPDGAVELIFNLGDPQKPCARNVFVPM